MYDTANLSKRHKKKKTLAFFLSCPEQDLNLHTLRHTHLKRTRLPIPPSGLFFGYASLFESGRKNSIFFETSNTCRFDFEKNFLQ